MGDLFENLANLMIAVMVIFIIVALICLPIRWLWNWLMPDLFMLPEIGFWQAVGISLLSSLLFKNLNYK